MRYCSSMRMRTGQSSQEQPATVPFLSLETDTAYPKRSYPVTGKEDEIRAEEAPGFPALELTIFNELREVFDPKILAQTYRDLLSQTRQRIEMLAVDHSSATLSKTGHTLRGTASMFGANAIALLATELEHSADNPAQHTQLLHRLEIACTHLEAALVAQKVSI